jgi:hypothetical protein
VTWSRIVTTDSALRCAITGFWTTKSLLRASTKPVIEETSTRMRRLTWSRPMWSGWKSSRMPVSWYSVTIVSLFPEMLICWTGVFSPVTSVASCPSVATMLGSERMLALPRSWSASIVAMSVPSSVVRSLKSERGRCSPG